MISSTIDLAGRGGMSVVEAPSVRSEEATLTCTQNAFAWAWAQMMTGGVTTTHYTKCSALADVVKGSRGMATNMGFQIPMGRGKG